MHKHVTTVLLVATGVMVAGYAMYALRDIDLINQARQQTTSYPISISSIIYIMENSDML